MTSNALIGVLAALGGNNNIKPAERNQALATAMALGGGNLVSGFVVGQGAVDRNARNVAQEELQLEQARSQLALEAERLKGQEELKKVQDELALEKQRSAELDQQADVAFDVAKAYDNMSEGEREAIDKIFGDKLVALTEVFREREPTPEVEQRVLPVRRSMPAPRHARNRASNG